MKKRLFCFVVWAVVMGLGVQSGWAEEKKEKKEAQGIKDITVVLESGVILHGTLFQPADEKKLTFVLLHGLGSNKGEWMRFADKLHTLGYGVCIYDARGHGSSRFDADNNELDYQTFRRSGKNTQWQLMIDDLEQVLVYLEKIEGLDKDRFVLGGASLGANVALNCAARRKNIRGIMLVSPGLDYAGIQTEYPMRFCKVPAIAIAAAEGDTYAYQSSQTLEACIRNKKKISFFAQKGSEHGVNMFTRGLDAQLLEWIRDKVAHK